MKHVSKGLYKRNPRQFSWMKEPWTCPKCRATLKAAGKGGHVRMCGKERANLFWSYVLKTDTCWLYQGTRSFEGYGYVNIGSERRRKQWQAHRYAWTLLKGAIPQGKFVLHRCDIRNCVNPAHLYLGNHKNNSDDKIARGRYRHARSPIDTLLWPELSVRVKS